MTRHSQAFFGCVLVFCSGIALAAPPAAQTPAPASTVALPASAATTALPAAASSSGDVPSLAQIQAFTRAFEMIKQAYVEPVSNKQLMQSAIRGMLAGLDPHSEFLDKSELKDLTEDTSGAYSGLGIEVAQDFANFMLNTFLPETENWAVRGPGHDIPSPIWKQIEVQVAEADATVFSAIRASGFRSVAAQAFLPDLSVGTIALWIDDELSYAPIQARPIPIRELEINIGPDGNVDDRFVVRQTRYRYLPRLLGGLDLPEEIKTCIKDKPNHKCEIKWGFWRLWDRTDDVVWQAVVMVDKKVVHATQLVGVGSCPLIVARFDPDPMFAFGEGPAVKALPTLRTLDEGVNTVMDRWDIAVSPPFAYPDDGVLNFEGGIKSGFAYPKQPGSEGFESLYFEGDADFAFFTHADMERRIRRLFYVDEPIQRGDTPPSATQWYEETVRAQRRIGMPGQIFWREFCAEAFLRYDYLLQQRGVSAPITVDGKTVSLTPYNPAMKAAEMQDVEVSVRFNETARTLFPMEHQMLVDSEQTMRGWSQRMGDTITVFRTKDQIEEAVARMSQIAGATQGEEPGG